MNARRRRPASWWALQKERVGGWLARSHHVFLVGVIVACGVEVLVDWNATLFEINVLRDSLRQRGSSYVGVLVKASEAPIRDRDTAALEHLSAGLFDDEDVAYVRFSDARGEVLYDSLRPGVDEQFIAHHGQGVVALYRHQITRDSEQILRDPAGLAERMRRSRYRDVVQRWSDAITTLTARLSKPALPPAHHRVILYQDRLADEKKRHDREMTYALGAVIDGQGSQQGVVLVAFSMARTNDATTKKFLKGGLMIAFFVGMILVQNLIARRDKLRLLDLEERHRAAKEALQGAMPGGEEARPGWRVGGAVQQAEGPVDGCLWSLGPSAEWLDLLVIEPDGEGIDAAATALQIGRAHRQREPDASAEQEIAALGQVVAGIPLTRPVGLMLLRSSRGSPRIEAITSAIGEIFVIGGGGPRLLAAGGADEEAPAGVVGPMRCLAGDLGPDELIALIAAGGSRGPGGRLDGAAVASFVARERANHPDLADLAHVAAEWAREQSPGVASSDLVVVLASRTGLPESRNR